MTNEKVSSSNNLNYILNCLETVLLLFCAVSLQPDVQHSYYKSLNKGASSAHADGETQQETRM